uniref:Uncharacterized protein n=1 Tax=Physcomitrium patens TaxID=3218 RepID=A0A2K1IE60_PHYPA|nr:hypothetical protein PHYPA_029716 [Physcomitrium patens]
MRLTCRNIPPRTKDLAIRLNSTTACSHNHFDSNPRNFKTSKRSTHRKRVNKQGNSVSSVLSVQNSTPRPTTPALDHPSKNKHARPLLPKRNQKRAQLEVQIFENG